MARLVYSDVTGKKQIISLPWQIADGFTIGSDSQCNLQLNADWGVLPKHAMIVRARAPVTFVLLDLSNGQSRVNEVSVFKMKVLRHLDKIQLGKMEMTFQEIHLEVLQAGSPYIGQHCILYGTKGDALQVGHEIVICRCGTPAHRGCWVQLEQCSREGCWYPISNLITKRLAGKVIIQKVKEGVELKTKKCSVDNRLFKPNEDIIYCPDCGTPYHLGCWLSQKTCPGNCGYIISNLSDLIFGDSAANE